MAWRGRPLDAAIGQYHATFCIDKQLITTSVDVVPGREGLTLGTDWLNDNVREWDLDTGKVNTYTGSFQTRMVRDVQMLRATSPKQGSPHILMGSPMYPARKKAPELTQLSEIEELLEFPPRAWSDDCPSDLDRSSEAAAYVGSPGCMGQDEIT